MLLLFLESQFTDLGGFLLKEVNQVSNPASLLILPHNLKHDGYIFKTLWGIFDNSVVCFLVFPSSSLIKLLMTCVTSEAIAYGRSIVKIRKTSHGFLIGIAGVFMSDFKPVKFSVYPNNIFKVKTHLYQNYIVQ